jgi:hypothetical protein
MRERGTDDQKRGSTGVVCSVHALSNGKLRVVMDDVTNSGTSGRGPWQHRALVTWKDYEPADLENVETISEAELAAFGHYMLTRLVAARTAGT